MAPPWSSRAGPSPRLPLSEAEGIQMGFVEGRINPSRSMVQVNHPLSPDPDWICASEDIVTMATQCATHWDSPAHCSYGGVIYNGYPAAAVTADGAADGAIHRLATVVSRVSSSTWPAPWLAMCSSRATPSLRTTSMRRALWPGSGSSPATSCWCARARWCTSRPYCLTWSCTPGRRPG